MSQGQLTAAVQHPVQSHLFFAELVLGTQLSFFLKDVLHVDVFLPVELRLPALFVITKDGFL